MLAIVHHALPSSCSSQPVARLGVGLKSASASYSNSGIAKCRSSSIRWCYAATVDGLPTTEHNLRRRRSGGDAGLVPAQGADRSRDGGDITFLIDSLRVSGRKGRCRSAHACSYGAAAPLPLVFNSCPTTFRKRFRNCGRSRQRCGVRSRESA